MGRKETAREIVTRLSAVISDPVTELLHGSPFELLVAVILSAQCTDARVNQVTPALFRAFPDVYSLQEASVSEIRYLIASITFPNNKARHLAGMAHKVVTEFDGKIPADLQLLETLPGVGRKTAQVVGGAAFGIDSMPVDTHVFRVAHRLELIRRSSETPDAVERDLRRVIAAGELSTAHHLFILHGRYRCTARSPDCEPCVLRDLCPQWRAVRSLPEPRTGLLRKKGRFWCGTRKHYVDHTVPRIDRGGVQQESCPRCGSMNLFDSKTGRTLRRVPDVRIGDMGYGRPDDRKHAS
ncbi:MAG: endonuclease-3 [Rhodothermales bacterium]|jgi:endonuclease-3